jgi:LPXTG-site transpeptidase (sortase) family protein
MDNNDINEPNTDDLAPLLKKRAYLYGGANPAADMIRQKLDLLYSKEPDAVEEAVESVAIGSVRTKHQQYMYELSTSGKPLAEVQTAWHEYYQSLNDQEKHAVWQEFYAANQKQSALLKAKSILPDPPAQEQQFEKPAEEPIKAQVVEPVEPIVAEKADVARTGMIPVTYSTRSVAEIKKQIVGKVLVRGKLSKKQHLQSLGFGLAMGSLVVIFLLFGFFNERFIAPFITPSRNVSATPLILDPNSASVDASPQIIIPKINVQVPAVYTVSTIVEEDIQAGLENGIVHYVTTSKPGEKGNAVFFGHSSSNILNRGRYKYAFVLLSWLEINDTFYIQKDGVRYVYKIFDKKVIKPTDVNILDPVAGHESTATLITCDPPGTNVNRMVLIGDQISPEPNANATSTAKAKEKAPKILASNSESLWHRLTGL